MSVVDESKAGVILFPPPGWCTCRDVSMQLDTKISSQKSMWKNWEIL